MLQTRLHQLCILEYCSSLDFVNTVPDKKHPNFQLCQEKHQLKIGQLLVLVDYMLHLFRHCYRLQLSIGHLMLVLHRYNFLAFVENNLSPLIDQIHSGNFDNLSLMMILLIHQLLQIQQPLYFLECHCKFQ